MGYEILTRPQVFRVKLSALGGIEGYVPPYISSFYTWTITAPSQGNTFSIPFDSQVNGPGLSHEKSGSFIVNISGSVVSPTEYFVNQDFRTITFNDPLDANTTFTLTQIGTIALSTANYLELTGVKFFSETADIINLNSSNIFSSNLTSSNVTTTNTSIVNANIVNADIQNLSLDRITTPFTATSLTANNVVIDANSDETTLLITQRGFGNSIVIEDERPDSSPFIINNIGDVGIGTITPEQKLDVIGSVRGQGYINTSTEVLSSLAFDSNFRITQEDGTGYLQMAWNVEGPSIGTGVYLTDDIAARLRLWQDGFTFYTASSGALATPITWTTGLHNNIDGNIGINTTTPSTVLHIRSSGTKNILTQETIDGAISPFIDQYLTPDYVDTRSGVNIYDPLYSYSSEPPDTHKIEFERELPIRPVNYWLTSNTAITAVFNLNSTTSVGYLAQQPVLQPQSEAYIVAVGGVIQPYTNYTINPANRTITFTQPIPADISVYVLQTLNPDLSTGYDSTPTQFVSASPSNTGSSTYTLTGLAEPLTDVLGQYVVTIDGIYQIPSDPPYSITPATSTLTFVSDVPQDLSITVTKLPSAVGPIEDACFISTLYTWTSTVNTDIQVLPLSGGPDCILSDRNSYLVNVGGILQVPSSYTIDPINKTITFGSTVQGGISPGGIDISVTQLAAPEFPTRYSTVFKLKDTCNNCVLSSSEEVMRIEPGNVSIAGSIATAPPVYVGGTYTVPPYTSSVILTANTTFNLPDPAKYPGRWLYLRNAGTFSATSNINVLLLTGSTSTAIYGALASRWAQLQSNGSIWAIMAQGNAD